MPQPKRALTHKQDSTVTLPAPDSPATSDRSEIEQQILAIGRQMAGREFASREEEQAFLDDMMKLADTIPDDLGFPLADDLMVAGDIPLMRDPTGFTPNPALEEAQDLVYQALETGNQRKRLQLARRALKVSPECADAYVLLAQETATTPEEERDLYAKGVAAGERALGDAPFREDVGLFWAILETRPYMRARHGLALALWELGQRDEAIGHYQGLLALNPGDNQGIRYLLLPALLEQGDDTAIGELLGGYEEDVSAVWLYSAALWRFRTEGASRSANDALTVAVATNPFVPPFLLGQKPLPVELPAFIGLGDEREAESYVADALAAWLRTPGAIEWLRDRAGE